MVLAVVLVFVVGTAGWMWKSFQSVKRIDLSGVLDPVSGDSVNYLLVGSDSRENLDPEAPDAEEPTVAGQRADTMILLRVGPEGSLMMSIPRDLWVTNAATGKKGRVNGAYNDGPANLITTIKVNLGVPINHYAEVDFASFAGVIDAVGGITIDFPNPVIDRNSGLDVTATGPQTLDGTMALAYVRSRHYTEIIDGKEVEDPTGDLGRQQRQQQFLTTALAEVGNTRNPWELARAASAMSKGLTIDDGLGFTQALSLARRLGSAAPQSVVLPTEGARIGGASVLLLLEDEAQPVLDQFR